MIVAVGIVSVLYGALVALAQTDLKRMIAYTSVNHMGYIVLALGAAGLLAQGAEQAGGIWFYSVTGNKPATNAWDVSDIVLGESGKSITVANDGLVPVCAAHWGKVLRDDYPWNHLDEINQVFGLIGSGAPDPLAFYRQQANRLKLKGL